MRKREIEEKTLRMLYCEEKNSDRKIAKLLGYSSTTVRSYRKKYGIDSIPKWVRHDILPTQRQVEIIYGTLLGDGHLANTNRLHCKHCNSSLHIKHSIKQFKYLEWLYEELKNLCILPPRHITAKLKNKRYEQAYISTFCHPFFTKLRDEFYPNGRKIITRDILNNITPLSIAVWFMDDGVNSKGGAGKAGVSFSFCTHGFTVAENEILRSFFLEKYSINTEIKLRYSYPTLKICNNSRKDFVDLVFSHIPDCMSYKRAKECKWRPIIRLYEDKEWIRDQFLLENKLVKDIADLAGVQNTCISNWAKKFGFTRDKPRRIKINNHYFDKIDSSEKSYWLGVFFGHGSIVDDKMFVLSENRRDIKQITKFRRAIESEHPIVYKDGRCVLNIYSLHIVEMLKMYGINSVRTKQIANLNIDKIFVRDWMRGYFDARFCFFKGRHSGFISGTTSVLSFIKNNCQIVRDNNVCRNRLLILFSQIDPMYHFLYDDCFVFNNTKRNKWVKKFNIPDVLEKTIEFRV